MEDKYGMALRVFTEDPQPRKVLHFDVFKLIAERNLFSAVQDEESMLGLLKTHEAKVRLRLEIARHVHERRPKPNFGLTERLGDGFRFCWLITGNRHVGAQR